MIVRTFGGIDIGFVIVGRVSVGDNDTLAKIVETIVGVTVQRGSEMFTSHVLYDVTYVKGSPIDKDKDSPMVMLLKALDEFGVD